VNSAIANRITLFLSFVGMFISGVLSLGKAFNLSVPCGGSHGCDIVAKDPMAMLFGVIPLAYVGFAAYAAFVAVAILRAYMGPTRLLVFGPLAASAIGAVLHIGLAMYSSAHIQTTCVWCMASMVTMVLLFLAHAVLAQMRESFAANLGLDRLLVVAFAVVLCGALGVMAAVIRHGVTPPYDAKALAMMHVNTLVPDGSNIYGDPKAPITIVEFADFFCPACHRNYPTVKKLVDENQGLVRLVYKHFPLSTEKGHEMSGAAAVVSEYAAAKGRFWQFADAFHAHDKGEFKSTDDLLGVLTQVGLNPNDADLKWTDPDDPAFKRVYADITLGNRLGLIMTPTFIVVAEGVPPVVCDANELESQLTDPRYDRFKSQHAKP
jgi:protein-disulfide isomerase/uncharacterized membrane protein